jgi:hypothetical protein
LEDELKKARSDSVMSIAASDMLLSDFEAELIRDLAGLQKLYTRNIRSIGDLCSPMSEGNPSVADYIRWLSMEVGGLPEMFASVNKNFISAAVEGALVIDGESVKLNALQDAAGVSGADILPVE